ncbi:unnamed protein product [Adineta ricciae]|uniref:DUF7709 domain-containing protein n=1 Tax=Adineta ricciae TaxID=249248 RepID=A0A815N0Y8_ADIRI|nr:unnamed protein product [Adineta ricciae]
MAHITNNSEDTTMNNNLQSTPSNSDDSTANDNVAATYCRILNVADGASLPAIQLKDGSSVQSGTVAAMLKNIERFNKGENKKDDEARIELERS